MCRRRYSECHLCCFATTCKFSELSRRQFSHGCVLSDCLRVSHTAIWLKPAVRVVGVGPRCGTVHWPPGCSTTAPVAKDHVDCQTNRPRHCYASITVGRVNGPTTSRRGSLYELLSRGPSAPNRMDRRTNTEQSHNIYRASIASRDKKIGIFQYPEWRTPGMGGGRYRKKSAD